MSTNFSQSSRRDSAINMALVMVLAIAPGISSRALAGAPEALKIGNGADWTFVNSKWHDTEEGGISGEKIGDGDGLQGYCLAFAKNRAYSDIDATFTIQMKRHHADQALIVRAQDPTRFYLIHFPQVGQSQRAQNFWAALSVADGSGYLRVKKVAYVRRIAANPPGIPHQARVKVAGDHFQVWVNGHLAIDAYDSTYKQGRIGLGGFISFAHGKVMVSGTEVPGGEWNDAIPQVKNWFVPFPDAGTRQGLASMAKAPNGDLLCAFSSGHGGKEERKLGRSKDGGKTWTVQPAPLNMDGSIHSLKDGRLVSITVTSGSGSWSESLDNGQTWTNVVPIKRAAGYPKEPARISSGYQLALKDGTLLRFGLGIHSTKIEPVFRWGAYRAQAFSIRSTDGGKTWSLPANLDATGREDMGNLDLTEPIAFEAKDGRIICLIRPIYSPWMWETSSTDQGKSWAPCVIGPFPGYSPTPPVRTASGLVVCATRFPGLVLHHTRDDGQTWDDGGGGTCIDTGLWAVGTMLEVEPNLLLFLHMDSWRDKLRAQFIRVTDHGLMPVRR